MPDVVVVGAGLSGLVCARRVREAGAEVVVLEARDRVGGRTLNEPIAPGRVVELGGQWVGPSHTEIMRVAAEVGVATFPTYITGEHLFSHSGRTSRYRGDIPSRMPFGLADFRIAQARLERMAKRIDLANPASTAWARRLDTLTVETWMRRHMRTRSGATHHAALDPGGARRPSRPSSRCCTGSSTSRTGGGLDSLIRTDGGYQQDRFVGGSQEIALRLARRPGRSGPAGRGRSRRIEHGAGRRRVHTASDVVRSGRRRRRCAAAPADHDRVRARPAGRPHPADPADATGHGHQVRRRLSDAVLARAGPVRARDDDRRAGRHDVRQLAARRQSWRADRVRAGRRRADARAALEAEDRRAAVLARLADLFGPRPRSRRSSTSAAGRGSSGPAAATPATSGRAGGRRSARCCAGRRGGSSGPARRPPSMPTARWTAPSPPASERRRRRWRSWARGPAFSRRAGRGRLRRWRRAAARGARRRYDASRRIASPG